MKNILHRQLVSSLSDDQHAQQSHDDITILEDTIGSDKSPDAYFDKKPIEPVSRSLLNGASSPIGKSATWAVNWFREPLQLPLFTLLGILLAIGHHLLYWQLDGRTVSNDDTLSQQAVKQAGNVFAFLAIASLKSVMDESYNQYAWMVIRSRSLKLGVIDKIFSLPFKISSFMSFSLFGEAKLLLLMGTFSWLLFIGGLTPAATLSIVPAIRSYNTFGVMPIPDYRSASWAQVQSIQTDDTINPTAQMLKIATESALSMAVIPPTAPASNSSYHLQFYGPTVQCNDSTSAQSLAFDYFMQNYKAQTFTYTEATFNASEGDNAGYLIFSAFSPTIADIGEALVNGRPDAYNNWDAQILPLKSSNGSQMQIWIETASYSMVCSLVNASFSINFNFSDGVGVVTSQIIDIMPATGASNTTAVDINSENTHLGVNVTALTNSAYYTTFVALGNSLFGNVSLENGTNGCNTPTCNKPLYLAEASSRILETGLIACDEIAHNYWYTTYGLKNVTNFPSEPWMCRNRTLARAIEDLANNITISMLSAANFTANTSGNIEIFESVNVYSYDKRNLLISYGVSIFVTLIAFSVGLLSVIKNGVFHESSFSTFMATTRNRELDVLAEGACLGDTKDIRNERLMFGILTSRDHLESKEVLLSGVEDGGETKNAGFGLEGSVTVLRKGDRCS